MSEQLSEEEVFSNDVDPLEAIAQIRREEGVAEEDLPVSDNPAEKEEIATTAEGEDELDNLDKDKQPDKDGESAEDTSTEDKTLDSASEDSQEDTEKDSDESDETSGTEDKQEEKGLRTFKADGKEFSFTENEMLEQFEGIFGKAISYTQKMQAIAPYRKMISALESEGVTHDQLNTAIDALKGNKQALQELMKTNGIDSYDLTEGGDDKADPYLPTDYGKSDSQLNIEDVTVAISKDPEYKITVDVIDNQWDQNSRTALSNNPDLIGRLHNDIKSGIYDKVAPVAMKMKVLDENTKSDIEYYILAGQEVLSPKTQESEKSEKTVGDLNKKAQDGEQEFEQASSEASKKRSASATATRSDRKGVIDYLEDDDEKYDAWYNKLIASN